MRVRRMCALPTFQIVLYGRSLGSGPTCFLAQKLTEQGTPCAGVILQSPLLSAYRVAFNFRFTVRPLQHRLIALSPIALPPPPLYSPHLRHASCFASDARGRLSEHRPHRAHRVAHFYHPWHQRRGGPFLARPRALPGLPKAVRGLGKVVLVLNYRLIYGSFLGAPACCRFRARPFWVTGAGHNNSTCTRCGSFFSPSSTYACSAAVLNPLPVESLLRDTTAFHDHIRYFLDSWCSRGIQFGSRGAKGKGKAHASGFR